MRPRRRFGQHFLHPSWTARVIAAGRYAPDDRVLEIGPGRGALTVPLSGIVGELAAVEVDRDLAGLLRTRLPASVRIIEGDVLEVGTDALFGTAGGAPWRVVGNLPYYISSPIVMRLLEWARSTALVQDATLMLQREVADRMASPPGSRQYGALSILVQLDADVERLMTLPPDAFRPAPEVWSALVRLRFRPPAVAVGDRKRFESLVRSLFSGRRKMLSNAVKPFASARGVDAQAVLRAAGLAPTRRPETLDLQDLSRLADAIDRA